MEAKQEEQMLRHGPSLQQKSSESQGMEKGMDYAARVIATEKTKEIIDTIRKRHGELMFHQSGGCCDGSQPMCFEKGDFKLGASDVWLGNIHNCDFYMERKQFEYWKHTHLTIDVVEGRGSSFSLEIPMGVRFIVRSRLFSEDESDRLEPLRDAVPTE